MRATIKPAAMAALAALLGGLTLTGGAPVSPGNGQPDAVDAHVNVASGTGELSGPDGDFSVELPVPASGRGNPTVIRPEVVDDGTTLRSVATISEGASATYTAALPSGARAELVSNDEGEQSVLIIDADGALVGGIATGDSVDANGDRVETEIEMDGQSISQTVAAGETPAYPVQMVALAGTVWYSWVGVEHYSRGYQVNANPTALGRQ